MKKNYKKIVLLEGARVVVRKSRARTLRLVVRQDGQAALSVPFFVSYHTALDFLRRQAGWLRRKRKDLFDNPPHLLDQGSPEEFRKWRLPAARLVQRRLGRYTKVSEMSFRKITIRDQRTRWGSCSLAGHASFNYRIVFLPPRLCDYVIVHELCHLREFNHSPAFWILMAKTFPDYRSLRRELRGVRAPQLTD